METGVTFQIWPPEKAAGRRETAGRWVCLDVPESGGLALILRGEQRINVVKLSSVSTGQLRLLPTLHSQPINLVVFQGTSGPEGPTKPNLGKGFALICFQRLS